MRNGGGRGRVMLCIVKYLTIRTPPATLLIMASSASSPRRRAEDPIPLHSRALEDLTFIRDTMARAWTVTPVLGCGGVAMGVTSFIGNAIASRRASRAEWLSVWLAEAVLALGIGGVAMVRKADASQTPLFTRAGKLFVRAFVPPIL